MIKRLKIALTLLALLLVSYGVYNLFHGHLHAQVKHTAPVDSPNIFMRQVTYDSHDQNGHLQATIKANTSLYYQQRDVMVLTRPDVTTYSEISHQPSWHITADHGESFKNNSEIKLSGHVKFFRYETPQAASMTVTTKSATLYPKRSKAVSDDDVSISQQQSTIQGHGMIANLKSGDYSLLSQLSGHYTPTNPKQP